MKYYIILSLLLLSTPTLFAQEIKYEVSVLAPKLKDVDAKVIKSLESSLRQWLNSQQWGEDQFEETERIEVNFQLTVEDISQTTFSGELKLQAVRPVYGSDYKTALITYKEGDITFSYDQYKPIEYSKTTYLDNLTSVLAFWSYVVLGYDYDSFSNLGGDSYYQLAQGVINNIPPNIASTLVGWNPRDGDRTRYWMLENMLSARIKPFRKAMYDYYINGLDMMQKDVAAGQAGIIRALETIDNVNNSYPNSMAIQLFCLAKQDEIVQIFKNANSESKQKVQSIMRRMDPANSNKYNEIGF